MIRRRMKLFEPAHPPEKFVGRRGGDGGVVPHTRIGFGGGNATQCGRIRGIESINLSYGISWPDQSGAFPRTADNRPGHEGCCRSGSVHRGPHHLVTTIERINLTTNRTRFLRRSSLLPFLAAEPRSFLPDVFHHWKNVFFPRLTKNNRLHRRWSPPSLWPVTLG